MKEANKISEKILTSRIEMKQSPNLESLKRYYRKQKLCFASN